MSDIATKEKTEEICLSDYNKISALDFRGIRQSRYEYKGRYYAFFEANARRLNKKGVPVGKTVREILDDYESGVDGLRDFVAAQGRVKDMIFETERNMGILPKGGHKKY